MSDATKTRTRTKFGVDRLLDGGWLVRGTQDPGMALKHVVAEMAEFDTDDLLFGVSREVAAGKRMYGELEPDCIEDMAAWLYGLIKVARPGLYRKNVCAPEHWEGWAWQLGYCNTRKPGVFEGVYFVE